MIANTYETVRKAITEKMQIVAVYQNHRREMCSHVLGTKNGRKQALFYQFGEQVHLELSCQDQGVTGDASQLTG